MNDIVNKIDSYINENKIGKFYKDNVFYDDGEECSYRDKTDLIKILSKRYPDDEPSYINTIAVDIIRENKRKKFPYIGSDPYTSDVDGEEHIIGIYDSQLELEHDQDMSSREI